MVPKNPIENIFNYIRDDLSLPKDFFSRLNVDDDWSLIIKLHALVESSLTSSLTKIYSQDELNDLLSLLPIRGRIGKLQLAKKLGVVTSEQCLFIDKLSKIRNYLVHDISNINASISEYYKAERLSDIINNSINSTTYSSKGQEDNLKVEQLYTDPKENIILATMILIIHLYGKSISLKSKNNS